MEMVIGYQELLFDLKEKYLGLEIINGIKSESKLVPRLWEDSKQCKIVLLLRVDTSTKWWNVFFDCNIACRRCEGSGIDENVFEWERQDKPCYGCNGSGLYSGPKAGCWVNYLPKRVQFDPPTEINAWKERNTCKVCNGISVDNHQLLPKCISCYGKGYKGINSWWVVCDKCLGEGRYKKYPGHLIEHNKCETCKGIGKKRLSGPSFASAIIIMDRRGLNNE